MLNRRRKLLQYLRRSNFDLYSATLSRLSLRDNYAKQVDCFCLKIQKGTALCKCSCLPVVWQVTVRVRPSMFMCQRIAGRCMYFMHACVLAGSLFCKARCLKQFRNCKPENEACTKPWCHERHHLTAGSQVFIRDASVFLCIVMRLGTTESMPDVTDG